MTVNESEKKGGSGWLWGLLIGGALIYLAPYLAAMPGDNESSSSIDTGVRSSSSAITVPNVEPTLAVNLARDTAALSAQYGVDMSDITMFNVPPPGWRRPDKNHCGEDLQRLYALMLLDETAASLAAKNTDIIVNPENYALFKEGKLDGLIAEERAIGDRLRANNCFFYNGGGSVYSDYKIMRDDWAVRYGRDLTKAAGQQITGQQATNMSYNMLNTLANPGLEAEQALQNLLYIVAQWW